MYRHVRREDGYSVVEVLVAMGVFLVALTAGIGIILAMVNANKKTQGFTAVMGNLNFALESITRDIRTGTHYYCGTRATGDKTSVKDCTGSGDIIFSFTDEDGIARYYYLLGSTIMESVGGYGVSEAPLSGNDVYVDKLQFRVLGSALADTRQPWVEILLQGHLTRDVNEVFQIQTVVVQRKLDIQ